MRFLVKLEDPDKARIFNAYLTSQGIQNELDVEINSDWADPNYGHQTYKIWVIDEDDYERAQELYQNYNNNPDDPKYRVKPSVTPFPFSIPKVTPVVEGNKDKQTSHPFRKKAIPVTTYLILICILVFFLTGLTEPDTKHGVASRFLPSPVEKSLLYDWPYAFELRERLAKDIVLDNETIEVPYEENLLLQEINRTPYWQGVYNLLVSREHPRVNNIPMFEKIREGELWRLITPIFLHGSILHILFNMLWLYFLGGQIERMIGALKYLLIVAIAAVFSNTAQYLVSGPEFAGFSGVICAFLTFIGERQRKAPWEGYRLDPPTYNFLMIFVLTMFGISLALFFAQFLFNASFNIGIANTAHMAGLAIGFILGRLPFFQWKG